MHNKQLLGVMNSGYWLIITAAVVRLSDYDIMI